MHHKDRRLSGCAALADFLLVGLLLPSCRGADRPAGLPLARMLTGRWFSGGSALILFAPELSYPVQIMHKLATALAIAALTFGWRDKLRLLAAARRYAALNILAAYRVLIIFQTAPHCCRRVTSSICGYRRCCYWGYPGCAAGC